MDHERVISVFIGESLEQAAMREPVFSRTAIPEGLGAPITPESLAVACDDALELGSVWTIAPHEWRDPRQGPIPAIAVMDRWRIGAPLQLWAAGGACRLYPAAYLAEFTFLDHDRGGVEKEARRRLVEPTGWRAIWYRWFPSGRDPVLRPQDRAMKSPPPAYFKQPDGGRFFPEPRHRHDPTDNPPEIV